MTKVTFRVPNWQRAKYILGQWGSQSILRCLEYEVMSTLGLGGRVLDYGGGTRTNYSQHVPSWGGPAGFVYESVNIDGYTQPTYLIDEAGNVPVPDASYDTVVSLNTFEHVYDLDHSLREIHRLIRAGGALVFIVPFVFRVHGHPDDYHRGTASFWERKLSDFGFATDSIEVMAWGPFSTAATVSGLPGPLKWLRRHVAFLTDLLYARLRWKGQTTVEGVQDASFLNIPVGYCVKATKL
jgi:SAM-dependent methyltransferase